MKQNNNHQMQYQGGRHQSNDVRSPHGVESTRQYFSSPEAFRCGYCEQSFSHKELLVRHLLTHISTRTPKPTPVQPSFSNYQTSRKPSVPTPQSNTRAFYPNRGDANVYPVQYLSQQTEMIQYDPNKMKLEAHPFRVASNRPMTTSRPNQFKVIPAMYASRISLQRGGGGVPISSYSQSSASTRSSSGTTTRGNVTPHIPSQRQLNPVPNPVHSKPLPIPKVVHAQFAQVMGEPPQKKRKTSTILQHQVTQPNQVATLRVHNVVPPPVVATKPPPLEIESKSPSRVLQNNKPVHSQNANMVKSKSSINHVPVHNVNQNQINISNPKISQQMTSSKLHHPVIDLDSKSQSPSVHPPDLHSKETQTLCVTVSKSNAMVSTDKIIPNVQSIATETEDSALSLSDFVNSVQYTPRPKTPKCQSVSVGIQIDSVLVTKRKFKSPVVTAVEPMREPILMLKNVQKPAEKTLLLKSTTRPNVLPSLQDLESEELPASTGNATTPKSDLDRDGLNQKRISLRLLLKNRKLSDVVKENHPKNCDTETDSETESGVSNQSSLVLDANKEQRVKYKPKDIVWIKFSRHREPAIISEVIYEKDRESPKMYQCLWLNWKDATNEHGRKGLLSITSEPTDKIQGTITDGEIGKLFQEDRISEDGKDAIRKWRLEIYNKHYDRRKTVNKMNIESKAVVQKA